MKKIAIIILSIIAFVGCSKTEVVEHYPDTEIDFSISTGNVVRAAYSNSNFSQFYVWGIYDNDGNSQYILNETAVNKSGDKWSYGSKKYWPEEGEVDFVGIYPSSAVAKTIMDPRTNTPISEINYAVSDSKREIYYKTLRANNKMRYAAALPDLVYAVAEDQTKDSNAGKAQMTFRHAMCQVTLEIKNENSMWRLRFRPDSAVVICNVRSQGIYHIPWSSTTTGVDTIGYWSFAQDEYQPFTFQTAAEANILEWSSTDTNVNYIRRGVFMKGGESAFMVPCSVPKWDQQSGISATAAGQNGAYFIVWCRIEVVTPSMYGDTEPYVLWGDIDAEPTDEGYYLPIYVPVAVNWKEGICYKYTFAFGRGLAYNEDGSKNLVPLTFSTEASSFTETAENLNMGN